MDGEAAVNPERSGALDRLVHTWSAAPVASGGFPMRLVRRCVAQGRIVLAVGMLAVTGCVATPYGYEYPQDRYYVGGRGYSSSVPPGYYRYPSYYGYGNYYWYPRYYGYPTYYGAPGYYGPVRYPLPPAHLGRNQDRHDRDHDRHGERDDRNARDGRGVGPPPGVLPPPGSDLSPQVPPGRNPCAGKKKCRPTGAASEGELTQERRQPRTRARSDSDEHPASQRALE